MTEKRMNFWFVWAVAAYAVCRAAPSVAGDGLLKVDHEYFMESARTGGDFYFWDPGEFQSGAASSPGMIAAMLGSGHDEPVLLAYGELDPEGETSEFTFPVEPDIKTLSFFIGLQDKLSVTVSDPEGKPLFGDEFRHMFLKTVEHPAAGPWKILTQGRGLFSVSVRACCRDTSLPDDRGIIDFYSFDTVERSLDIHGGYFAKEGAPAAESREICQARILGKSYATAQFQSVAMDGRTIGDMDLKQNYPQAYPKDFVGPCEIPRTPFRVKVTGEDINGMPYQRFSLPLIEPLN